MPIRRVPQYEASTEPVTHDSSTVLDGEYPAAMGEGTASSAFVVISVSARLRSGSAVFATATIRIVFDRFAQVI